MNYVALGIFGGYLHLSSRTLRLRRVVLGVAILGLLATVPIRADRGLMKFFSEVKGHWKTCYLTTGSISECDTAATYNNRSRAAIRVAEEIGFSQALAK
jgi:hypothetical protein